MDLNEFYYFFEDQQPPAGQAPTSEPTGAAGGAQAGPVPPQGGPGGSGDQPPAQPNLDDVTQDPPAPDMPADPSQDQDYNAWEQQFFKLAAKGDPAEMMEHVQPMRDAVGLEAPQRKFVEDNWQVLVLRQNANIDKASKEVRKLLKQGLDRNAPGATAMQHLSAVLEQADTPALRDVFIKLTCLFGMKADLHRKFLAALFGAIQTGGGGSDADISYAEKDFSVRAFTRFGTQFGEISLGKWSLQKDDPDRYLAEPELERLSDGSPEEKQVLRRRVVIESIAERFKERSFLIHVVSPDGTIYGLGWDMAEGLLDGYRDGKLIVRSRSGGDAEAMIDDEGAIVPLLDLNVYYLKETGETDETGRPRVKEVPFIERRDGTLYLVATLETVRDVFSGGMTGAFFKETPFAGNPSDLQAVARAIPNIEEILMRRIQ